MYILLRFFCIAVMKGKKVHFILKVIPLKFSGFRIVSGFPLNMVTSYAAWKYLWRLRMSVKPLGRVQVSKFRVTELATLARLSRGFWGFEDSKTNLKGTTLEIRPAYMGDYSSCSLVCHCCIIGDLHSCITGMRAGCRLCFDFKQDTSWPPSLVDVFLFVCVSHRSRVGVLHRFLGIEPEAW